MSSFAVRLALYDLSQGMARQFSPMLGLQLDYIPHTGVLVFGKEWFFGGGIQEMRHEDVIATFGGGGMRPVKEPEVLGRTTRTRDEFVAFLQSISSRFTQHTYDLMHNNCNHFSDACVRFLLHGVGIPQEIVTLPNLVLQSPLGQAIRPLLAQMQSQMQNQFVTESSSSLSSSTVATFSTYPASTSTSPPPPTLLASLTALQAICSSAKDYYDAVTTLHRVIGNITAHPLEAKFRRVQLGNARFHATLGRHSPHGVGCMLGLGFVQQGEGGGVLVVEAEEEKWPKLVMGERVVAAARKKAIAQLCIGVADKDQALALVLGGNSTEDKFVQDAVRDIFERV